MTNHRFGSALLLIAGGLAVTSLSSVAGAVSSAEMYTSKSYFYGRFVARAQFAAGDGVVSSFFLWKDGSEKSGTFWNELDFEKLGADCHLETNAYYGSPAVVHSAKAKELTADLCGEFHTYTYEWTPDYIAWLVDGTEIRRVTGEAAAAYAENATAGMQLRFNIWPGDATFGGKFSPSILPVYEYINWVEYYSYNDGEFKLDWREDFDAKSVSSRWALGSWDSPKGLSTHSPSNVNIVNGFAVLSLTDDEATGAGDAAPDDPGGSGSDDPKGTGGSGSDDPKGTGGSGSDDSEETGGSSSDDSDGVGGTASSSTTKAPATTSAAPASNDSGGCSIQSQVGTRRAAHSAFLVAAVGVLLAGMRRLGQRSARRRSGSEGRR